MLSTATTRAEVCDLSSRRRTASSAQDGKLLEVYRPVWTPNGSPLLFETYLAYDTVTARTPRSVARVRRDHGRRSLLLLLVLMAADHLAAARPACGRVQDQRVALLRARRRRLDRGAPADRRDPARRCGPGARRRLLRRVAARPRRPTPTGRATWPTDAAQRGRDRARQRSAGCARCSSTSTRRAWRRRVSRPRWPTSRRPRARATSTSAWCSTGRRRDRSGRARASGWSTASPRSACATRRSTPRRRTW